MEAASAVEIQRVLRGQTIVSGAHTHVPSEMQPQLAAHAQLVGLPPATGPCLDLRGWVQDALLLKPDQLLLSELGAALVLLLNGGKHNGHGRLSLSCSFKP